MNKAVKKLKEEWDNLDRIKVFEIPVIDKRTGEKEFVVFHILCNGEEFIAQHESLTEIQEKSNKIAFVSIPVDEWFSLDFHLQELHTYCIHAIMESDFFKLDEDER
jgi:hypothetical protein